MNKTLNIFYKHFDDTDQEENFLELKTKKSLKEEIISAMEEYAEEKAKSLINALEDIKNWDDDLEDEWEDAGYRAISALKKWNESK